MTPDGTTTELRHRRLMSASAFIVMCVAVTGYFIGLSSPMPDIDEASQVVLPERHQSDGSPSANVIPATSYTELPKRDFGPNREWSTHLVKLNQSAFDPFAEIALDPNQKIESLRARQQLRAFNGAPPVIPHPITQLSTENCNACHALGLRTGTLRAAQTPHPYYTNCTQCHVQQDADFVSASIEIANDFAGLPAPQGGPRAYPNAPPSTPHSTWMRQNCLACHGRTAASGMETTHPWRTNCLQCHPVSAGLEQMQLGPQPIFLPPLSIQDAENDE